ncbi:hypothetical protein CRM22_000727 [Opisthorchis felineus]|uniref:G-protein coupled receptors family 1 profile domain-containing protein n=1 Tax=Opisthorchis felineus TaxID=147828 RepID=A0A4S2ME09_OPIFE|nr:hypothetical protein CRM22_000727 [Opisthorchis felineus]
MTVDTSEVITNISLLCLQEPQLTSIGFLQGLKEYFNACVPEDERSHLLSLMENILFDTQQENLLRQHELILIILVYATFMLFGSLGSLSIISVVCRYPRMRTTHNFFTANLAVGDLFLCLFTQPFNLLRILYWHFDWTLGQMMCKAVATAQTTNIFVSTLNISAIAIDRFQVIVYPQRKKMQRFGALVTIGCIWVVALFLACPMIAFTSVSHGIIRSDASVCSASTLDSHGLRKAKLVYGGVTLVVQYLFPVTIVGFAYTRIYLKIRTRQKNHAQNQLISSRLNRPHSRWMGRNQLSSGFEDIRLSNCNSEHDMFTIIGPETVQSNGRPPRRLAGPFRDPNRLLNTDQSDRDRQVHRRQIKTNALLLAITLTFILSWTPLHVFNLTMDMVETQRIDILSLVSLANQESSNHSYSTFNQSKSNGVSQSGTYLIGRNVTIIHAICLLCVHLAACINPILYGWLNENFCQIFRQASRNYLAWCRLRLCGR